MLISLSVLNSLPSSFCFPLGLPSLTRWDGGAHLPCSPIHSSIGHSRGQAAQGGSGVHSNVPPERTGLEVTAQGPKPFSFFFFPFSSKYLQFPSGQPFLFPSCDPLALTLSGTGLRGQTESWQPREGEEHSTGFGAKMQTWLREAFHQLLCIHTIMFPRPWWTQNSDWAREFRLWSLVYQGLALRFHYSDL